jgi:hypothetical protein
MAARSVPRACPEKVADFFDQDMLNILNWSIFLSLECSIRAEDAPLWRAACMARLMVV